MTPNSNSARNMIGGQISYATRTTTRCLCLLLHLHFFPLLHGRQFPMSNDFWNTNTDFLLSKYSGISARDADAYNAMKALDKEVAAMSRAMNRIKSLRNSLNPFHRLPPEIISRCFHILAEMEPPTYKKDTKTRPTGNARQKYVASIGWIKVSILYYGCLYRYISSTLLITIGHPRLWHLEVHCHWGPHALAGPLILRHEA